MALVVVDLARAFPPLVIKPDSDVARLFKDRGWPMDERTRRVLGTRRQARDLIDSRPDITPTIPVWLDARDVEVVSGPFFHELRQVWPLAELKRANEDVQGAWDIVTERLDGAA